MSVLEGLLARIGAAPNPLSVGQRAAPYFSQTGDPIDAGIARFLTEAPAFQPTLGGMLSKTATNLVEPSSDFLQKIMAGDFEGASQSSMFPVGGITKYRGAQLFPESNVVDEAGDLLTLYHGSDKVIDRPSMKKGAQGLFWMTSDKAAIEAGEVGASARGVINEFKADIKNPAGWKEYEKYSVGELKSLGYDGIVLPDPDGSFNAVVFKPDQVKKVTRKVTDRN